MIEKLEWTQGNYQQNIDQLQNLTVGETTTNQQQQILRLWMDSHET